jgi:hypothetical protein
LSKLDKELEENSENYIPTTIRDALESAGINIDEIISMKNQLEMSLVSSISLSTPTKKSPKFFASNNDNSVECADDGGGVKASLDENNNYNFKSTNQLVSLSSNLKAIDIKQNLSAKVIEQVENVSTTTRRASGRKKSSGAMQNRYATVTQIFINSLCC